jgi:hypothetical protein
MEIKCIVACQDKDLFFVKVDCTQDEYDNGQHYEAAEEAAVNEGLEPAIVFDENDPGGRAMLDLFEWQSASVVQCEGDAEPGM